MLEIYLVAGITTEMGDNGMTILRCSQEVDHSRPYFVGTIGQRYGWHQDPDPAAKEDKLLTKTFETAKGEHLTSCNYFIYFI